MDRRQIRPQFQVNGWHELVPPTIEGILGYLSSGLLKGIGPKTAEAIVQRFGTDSLDVIEHRPEKLLGEGLTLLNEKIPQLEQRLQRSQLEQELRTMVTTNVVVSKKGNIYLPHVFNQESETARKVVEMLLERPEPVLLGPVMERIKGKLGITLSPRQYEGVEMAFRHNLSIITGGSGIGKSTMLKAVIEAYQVLYPSKTIALGAPTGKAFEEAYHPSWESAGIPSHIPYKGRLVVTGEAFIRPSDFEVLLDTLVDGSGQPYKNGRNLAAGSVRLLKSEDCRERRVTFMPFNVLEGFDELSTKSEKLKQLQGLSFHPYDNPDCATRRLRQFVQFAGKKAMNVEGLSAATLEKLIGWGLLHDYWDIYELDEYKAEVMDIDGFGEKSWENLWDAIQRSRNTTFERYLWTQGFPNPLCPFFRVSKPPSVQSYGCSLTSTSSSK